MSDAEEEIEEPDNSQNDSANFITPEGRRNIYALSSAAFFNDTGSDMLTPAYSTFMTSVINAPQWIIGLLDSLSMLFGALLSPLGGKLSDKKGRKIFIWIGYILLMISRGTQALANVWSHLVGPKIIYEFGRGIRNPAREAMITEDIPEKKRGWAFGLLQSADSTGAILGPTLGYLLWNIFLYSLGWNIEKASRILIGIAAVPTILSVLIILIFVRDLRRRKENPEKEVDPRVTEANHPDNKKQQFENKPVFIFIIILVVILFLGIPTESLLLTMAQDRYGYTGDTMFILFFFFNLFYALVAYPAGVLSDKYGARIVFMISTAFLVLFGILSAVNQTGSLYFTIPTLMIFGIFRGSIFPPMMKLVAKIIPRDRRGEMMGTFSMFRIGSQIASPFILGGLFSISSSTQYLPYVFICILAASIICMMIFAPKILKNN